MTRRTTSQSHCGSPQRIIGGGNQYLVPHIQQPLHRQGNQFRSTIADENVIHPDSGNFLLLGVMHDRLARREQALGIGIPSRVGHIVDHILLNFLRRFKAERGQVADIQLDDAMPFFLHLPGSCQHGSAYVITDIRQLGGFGHGSDFCKIGGLGWFHFILSHWGIRLMTTVAYALRLNTAHLKPACRKARTVNSIFEIRANPVEFNPMSQ